MNNNDYIYITLKKNHLISQNPLTWILSMVSSSNNQSLLKSILIIVILRINNNKRKREEKINTLRGFIQSSTGGATLLTGATKGDATPPYSKKNTHLEQKKIKPTNRSK